MDKFEKDRSLDLNEGDAQKEYIVSENFYVSAAVEKSLKPKTGKNKNMKRGRSKDWRKKYR